MIFVTVGTHTAPFDRLIAAMDAVAARVDEPVVMQIGCARVEPRHATWFRFAPYEEMQRYCEVARVVVCQPATSILVAIHAGAAVVAVPRRRDFGEAIDDHQVEFMTRMAERGLVTPVDDMDALQAAVMEARPTDMAGVTTPRQELAAYARTWLA